MKIIEFYQDTKAFYIVSEFYNGGELFDKISNLRNFSEKMAASTIKQILSAVNYCHQNNIVHRYEHFLLFFFLSQHKTPLFFFNLTLF